MTYAWDMTLKTVTVDTENMTLPDVDGMAGKFTANIQVHDNYGNTAYGHINPLVGVGSGTTVDVSGLEPNKGLNVTTTIVANIGWSATGSAFDIVGGATGAVPVGNLQDWNIADEPANADDSLIS